MVETTSAVPPGKGTVVITGGSGLIGQALAKRLAPEFRVVSLDVKEPGERQQEEIRLPDGLERDSYRIVKSFTARPGGQKLRRTVEFRVS